MPFLQSYWWVIIAVAGLLAYTLSVVRRANRDITESLSARDASTRPASRETSALPDRKGTGAILVLILLLVVTVVARETSHRFQVVRATTLDYVLVAIVGVVFAAIFARRQIHRDFGPDPRAQPHARGATVVRSMIGLAIGVVLGSAVLQILNGALDPGRSRRFATVVADRRCGNENPSLTLRGAPALPVEAPSIELNGCGDAVVGDTVFLDIKPGWFGRPWVAGRHLQTSEERFRQRLEEQRRRRP